MAEKTPENQPPLMLVTVKAGYGAALSVAQLKRAIEASDDFRRPITIGSEEIDITCLWCKATGNLFVEQAVAELREDVAGLAQDMAAVLREEAAERVANLVGVRTDPEQPTSSSYDGLERAVMPAEEYAAERAANDLVVSLPGGGSVVFPGVKRLSQEFDDTAKTEPNARPPISDPTKNGTP